MTDTPMKKIKGNLGNLKVLLVDDFSHKELNQRNSRVEHNHDNYTDRYVKEIISDFKHIFNAHKSKELSFSITYDYLNKPVEKHSIQLSVCNNGNFKNSLFMSVSEFNLMIKSLNRNIKSFSKNNPEGDIANYVINEIYTNLIQEEYNLELEVSNSQKSITSFLVDKKEFLGITKLEETFDINKKDIIRCKDIVKNSIETSEDYIELQRLKESVKKLEERVNTDKTTLEFDYFIPQTIEQNKKIALELKDKNKTMQTAVDNVLSQTNSIVRSKIKIKQ
jgi:hypothetical protein